jgi:proteasome lid subunit RPN8/RPN11
MDENGKSDCRVPEFPSGGAPPPDARLYPPESVDTELVIPRVLFDETLAELEIRSAEWRESAAIFCGRVVGSQWVADVVKFHHHLCDDRGRSRSTHLTEAAKFRLYEELSHRHLRLVAGIHTHPEDWVDLSWIDQRNQLCSRKGFWSIVVPWYSKEPWLVENMGVHIRTSDGWGRLTSEQVRMYVRIRE